MYKTGVSSTQVIVFEIGSKESSQDYGCAARLGTHDCDWGDTATKANSEERLTLKIWSEALENWDNISLLCVGINLFRTVQWCWWITPRKISHAVATLKSNFKMLLSLTTWGLLHRRKANLSGGKSLHKDRQRLPFFMRIAQKRRAWLMSKLNFLRKGSCSGRRGRAVCPTVAINVKLMEWII